MAKKIIPVVLFVLLLSMLLSTAALAQDEELKVYPLEIRNRTDQSVTILLIRTEGLVAYSLTVPANTTSGFTIKEGLYNHTTFACGESAEGTVTIEKQLRLIFTPCFRDAPNNGAPTMEKIHLTDAPTGINYNYQFK
jgi:hypothetical protein